MTNELNWDDVASFVSEYMASGQAKQASGDLLEEVALAYVRARHLPSSALPTVIQMVDSVL